MAADRIPGIQVNPRRVVLIAVSPELLIEWWKEMQRGPITLSCDGIPLDARVVGSTFDRERDVFVMKLESESFPLHHEGDAIQYVNPTFTRHYE
jgi:hypothetical protein